MDLSINESVKELMRSKFRDSYSAQVQRQLDKGEEISPVGIKLSTMKPLGARWLVSLYDYISSIVQNGFKTAGILSRRDHIIVHVYTHDDRLLCITR